jgi:hypothetical protein
MACTRVEARLTRGLLRLHAVALTVVAAEVLKMKLIHLPLFGLLLAHSAAAADLGFTATGPVANPMQHLRTESLAPGNYRLGLEFEEAFNFVIDPTDVRSEDTRAIQRRLNMTAGLPWQSEFGLTLFDTQESAELDKDNEFNSAQSGNQRLGGKFWLRWNFLSHELYSASFSAEYQPGISSQYKFYQASQDRSSYGLDFKLKPSSYFEATLYSSFSHRKGEKYRNRFLGDEVKHGFRFALGSETAGLFGDIITRHLMTDNEDRELGPWIFGRKHTLGVYAGTENVRVSAYTFIPDKNRYIGVPERGFGASLSYTIGNNAVSSSISSDEKSESKPSHSKDENGHEWLKQDPVSSFDSKDQDEFQAFEDRLKQEAGKDQAETLSEKAEREMRESLENERKEEVKRSKDREQDEARKIRENNQERMRDAKEDKKFQEEAREEVKGYNLPDKFEVNWKGLEDQISD